MGKLSKPEKCGAVLTRQSLGTDLNLVILLPASLIGTAGLRPNSADAVAAHETVAPRSVKVAAGSANVHAESVKTIAVRP